MKIKLKGDLGEFYCEITEVLDEYLLLEYKNIRWMKSYICPYDKETLLIRVPGATRGNIKLDGNKIKEFNLYKDTSFSKKLGCYDPSKEFLIMENLNRFIGSEFI